jgi:hypothetical protein
MAGLVPAIHVFRVQISAWRLATGREHDAEELAIGPPIAI